MARNAISKPSRFEVAWMPDVSAAADYAAFSSPPSVRLKRSKTLATTSTP
jgi:hypothetical protein